MTEIDKAARIICGDFTVTEGTMDKDYTFLDMVLTIRSSAAVTIRNTDPTVATMHRIKVAGGVNANITLAGVNIDVSANDNEAAFRIEDGSDGNVNLILYGSSSLKSGENCAGLQKNGTSGQLTISGEGSLTGTGGFAGAGIGGGGENDGSNIVINGGSVTAKGGGGSAGIGGGIFGSGSNITISGGSVTATGGMYGAGIGGGLKEAGCGGAADHIEISGGSVTAIGGVCAAGIGGGDSAKGSDIEISGGIVTAKGGSFGGQSIGGGMDETAILGYQSIGGSNNFVGGHRFAPADAGTTSIIAADTGGVLLIDGKRGTVTGHVSLDNDITIPNGVTLVIGGDADRNSSLTVEQGAVLTNNGTVNVAANDRLVINGTFLNNGSVMNHGDIICREEILGGGTVSGNELV